jgi:hypothetical protein
MEGSYLSTPQSRASEIVADRNKCYGQMLRSRDTPAYAAVIPTFIMPENGDPPCATIGFTVVQYIASVASFLGSFMLQSLQAISLRGRVIGIHDVTLLLYGQRLQEPKVVRYAKCPYWHRSSDAQRV